MSFRMGVFIEEFSNRAAEEKTSVTAQGAATSAAHAKRPRRATRKKAEVSGAETGAERPARSDATGHWKRRET